MAQRKLSDETKHLLDELGRPVSSITRLVRFGDPNMTIKKHIPERRENFRARHNCDNPGSKLKARYWACKAW